MNVTKTKNIDPAILARRVHVLGLSGNHGLTDNLVKIFFSKYGAVRNGGGPALTLQVEKVDLKYSWETGLFQGRLIDCLALAVSA